VMAQLNSMEPSRVEKLEERVAFSSAHELIKSMARRYVHYRRNMAHREYDEGFLRYLEVSFGTRSLGGTFLWVVRRAQQGWPKSA